MSYATKRELLSLGNKPPYDVDVPINGEEWHHVKLKKGMRSTGYMKNEKWKMFIFKHTGVFT